MRGRVGEGVSGKTRDPLSPANGKRGRGLVSPSPAFTYLHRADDLDG